MMRAFRLYLFVVVLMVSCASCKTEPVEPLACSVTKLLPGQWLNGVETNDAGALLVCGGVVGSHGSLLRSADQGVTWSVVLSDPEKCFYFVHFVNDTLVYAGGDYVTLWRSVDAGVSWQFVDLADTVPTNEFDRPAFRQMASYGSRLVMVGGDNAKKGVVYVSDNNGYSWRFSRMDHQLAGVDVNIHGQAIVCGWGYLALLDHDDWEPQQMGLRGDFFTSVAFTSANEAVLTGYSGRIYNTSNGGHDWVTVRGFKACKFNYLEMTNDKLMAASDDGLLALRLLGSDSWNLLQLPIQGRVLHLTAPSCDLLVAVTDEGALLNISLKQL